MGKADLHLHTTESDGMMSPAMLMNYIAACTDLDVIAITDHNTMDGWARAREFQLRPENDHLHQLELVPGIEVSSDDGHVLGIGVSRVIPKSLSAAETIAAIHEQGGLALAPHPFAWVPGMKDFAGVGGGFKDLPFDGVEVRNSNATELFNNHRVAWVNRRQTAPLAEYGASDAHFLWAIGRTWTEYPGRGFAALRVAFRHRTTRAQGMTWGPVSLAQYFIDRFRWGRFCRAHGVVLSDL
jgi:predicted metal-dependent phosphoesterase TrpH